MHVLKGADLIVWKHGMTSRILLELSHCSSCHASHSVQTGKGKAFWPISDAEAKGYDRMDILPAKTKCLLGHENNVGTKVIWWWNKIALLSKHWVAVPRAIPATLMKPARGKHFDPVSDVRAKVVRRWTRMMLPSRLMHTKEAKTIWVQEQPTEWRKPEGKTTANLCQARDPPSGTMCTVHTATGSAFHISTSEGPVGGDTPGLWVH